LIRLPLDEKQIKKIVGENPSKFFKLGYVDLEIPSKLLKVGNIRVTFKIPKTMLVNEHKTGKIGSYQIKELLSGKARGVPILRTMVSKFTTIDLVVDDH
jgi:hypothetical protein